MLNDDDKMDDVMRDMQSPSDPLKKEFSYQPRKISFKQFLKDVNETKKPRKGLPISVRKTSFVGAFVVHSRCMAQLAVSATQAQRSLCQSANLGTE